MIVHRCGQGEMLDLIAFRYYGTTPGAVELVLDVNRHLAALPAVLPIGTMIVLPRIDQAAAPTPATIKLWD